MSSCRFPSSGKWRKSSYVNLTDGVGSELTSSPLPTARFYHRLCAPTPPTRIRSHAVCHPGRTCANQRFALARAQFLPRQDGVAHAVPAHSWPVSVLTSRSGTLRKCAASDGPTSALVSTHLPCVSFRTRI